MDPQRARGDGGARGDCVDNVERFDFFKIVRREGERRRRARGGGDARATRGSMRDGYAAWYAREMRGRGRSDVRWETFVLAASSSATSSAKSGRRR